MSASTVQGALGQFRGRIVRWGQGDYGFIECASLKRDAYFKESWIVGFVPSLGDEVEFTAVEYPGDKVVAKDIRAVGGQARRPAEGGRLAGKIRGLDSLPAIAPAKKPTPGSAAVRPATPALASSAPTTLSGVVRGFVGGQQERVHALRADAAALEAKAAAVVQTTESIRAEAARKRVELERQIAEVERTADMKITQLALEAKTASAQALDLRQRSTAFEVGTASAARKTAVEFIAGAHKRVLEELVRRQRALAGVGEARIAAIAAAGEDKVRKYDRARQKSRDADPDDREAFALQEQHLRQALRPYAESVDRAEGWQPLETPIWLVGSGEDDKSRLLVAPFKETDWESDPSWRLGCALTEAIERGRMAFAGADGADAIAEQGAVAGFLAVRMNGMETDLFPLVVDEVHACRPTLQRLGVAFRVEEVPAVPLDMDASVDEGDALEDQQAIGGGAPSGGILREVANRLGMTAPELVSALVASGLPFPDDAIDVGTEESLRALLGIAATTEPEPAGPAAPPPAPAGALPEELSIAGRILAKLLRAHVIGGKHTRIENVYGHHFSDAEKDRARDITQKLARLGILREKMNVGSRHVSIDPRRLEDARALAEGKSPTEAIRAALLS